MSPGRWRLDADGKAHDDPAPYRRGVVPGGKEKAGDISDRCAANNGRRQSIDPAAGASPRLSRYHPIQTVKRCSLINGLRGA